MKLMFPSSKLQGVLGVLFVHMALRREGKQREHS